MTGIFIDTGAFLAREMTADQHHEEALKRWQKAVEMQAPLYTSFHVLDETVTLLARRTTYAWAADWGNDVLECPDIECIQEEPEDWRKAMRLMGKYADQGISCTDALSFVLMKKHGITKALGFDRHFSAAGFTLLK